MHFHIYFSFKVYKIMINQFYHFILLFLIKNIIPIRFLQYLKIKSEIDHWPIIRNLGLVGVRLVKAISHSESPVGE